MLAWSQGLKQAKQQLAVDIAWSRKQTPVECLSILNTLLLQATTRTGSVVKKVILSSCILERIKDEQKFCALKFYGKKLNRRKNKPTLFSFINISFEQTKFLIVRWKDVVMRATNIILAHRHDENTFKSFSQCHLSVCKTTHSKKGQT